MSDDLHTRVAVIEHAVLEIRDALKTISGALVNMAALEAKHVEMTEALHRAFTAIEKNGARISDIEKRAPIWDLVTKYAIAGTVAVVGMVGTGVVMMVVK